MIELKNIQVEFSRDGASATAAVDDVSLTILEGEVFGIIGSSGAGKSTLVRTINLLQKPTSGDIVIDGASIVGQTGARLRETRCGIGMIFQHFNLWNAKTVYDNVAFPLKCARWSKQDIEERVVELLEFVNLEEKRDAYPQTLSGGQKQRVAIARALAANTRILLCDEPTSALDLETTKSVLDVLKRVNQQLGVTIVVITHELDVAKPTRCSPTRSPRCCEAWCGTPRTSPCQAARSSKTALSSSSPTREKTPPNPCYSMQGSCSTCAFPSCTARSSTSTRSPSAFCTCEPRAPTTKSTERPRI